MHTNIISRNLILLHPMLLPVVFSLSYLKDICLDLQQWNNRFDTYKLPPTNRNTAELHVDVVMQQLTLDFGALNTILAEQVHLKPF